MADRESESPGDVPQLSRGRAALFYLIMFALVLLVVELGARLVIKQSATAEQVYVPHELYDYVRVSYPPLEVPPKPPGEKRILLLGDSLSEGWGAGEMRLSFPELLRERLREVAPEWRFLNSGVGGWGPVKQRRLLENELERIRPDLVMVQVTLTNDVTDATGATRKQLFHGAGLLASSIDTPAKRALAWARLNVRLVYIAMGAWNQIPMFLARRDVELPYPDVPWRTFMNRRPWNHGQIWAITKQEDPFYDRGLEILYENYAAIGRLAASVGAEVLFVLVPDRTQVIEPLRKYMFELNGIPDEQADLMKLNRLIVPFIEEHGMSVIDLTPRIRARPPDAPMLYYTHWDGHLNALGHRYMADLMWDEWLRQRVAPR